MGEVPYGYCHCECGGKTKIATSTIRKYGWVKGEPRKYIMNHDKRAKPVIEDAVPFKIDGVYCRLIPLTQCQYAIVDADDYLWLMAYKWYAHWSPAMESYYAKARIRDGAGTEKGMHTLITKAAAGQHPHHINEVTLDNRRKNLTLVSPKEHAGRRGLRNDNHSGYRGVHWMKDRKMWVATVQSGGKRTYIGAFATAEEAARAYDERAREVYGAMAKPNFP